MSKFPKTLKAELFMIWNPVVISPKASHLFELNRCFLKKQRAGTRKVLLQCPQETRAPAGWGSGLAGPGWTGPRFIILLLEGDRQTHNVSIRTRSDSRYYSVQVLANNASWCWEQSSQGLTAASWNSSAFTPLITTHTAFLQSAFSHGYSSSESLIRPRGWDVSGLVSMSGLNAK